MANVDVKFWAKVKITLSGIIGLKAVMIIIVSVCCLLMADVYFVNVSDMFRLIVMIFIPILLASLSLMLVKLEPRKREAIIIRTEDIEKLWRRHKIERRKNRGKTTE